MASRYRGVNLRGGWSEKGEVPHSGGGVRVLRGLEESRECKTLRKGLFHTCVFDGGLRGQVVFELWEYEGFRSRACV